MRLTIALALLLAGTAFATDNLLSQQSGTSLPVNTWVKLTPPGALGYTCDPLWLSVFYVPSLDVITGMCDFRSIGTEPNRSWIAYSLKNNSLYVLDNNSTWHNEHFVEGSHPVVGSAIDPTASVLYGWGGFSGSQGSERYHTTYAYDFNARTGRNLQTATNPNYNIQEPSGAFDPLRGQFVEHGGAGGVGTNIYTVSTNSWAFGVTCTTNAAGCPKNDVTNAAMAYSTLEDAIYLFGGLSGGSGLQNETHRYNPVSQTWTAITISGSSPSARQAAAMVYMPDENKFLLWGGGDAFNTNVHADTWVFDPVASTWTQLTPAASPVPFDAVYGRMGYFPGDGVAVLFNYTSAGATEVWAYRYNPGSNAGFKTAPSYSASAGSLNRNSGSWAQSTSLDTAGSGTYFGAWTETGNNATSARYLYPYGQQWVGGTVTNLGSAFNSMASETSPIESDDVAIGSVAGVPWACWHEQNNSSFLDRGIAKFWNGSIWSGGFFGLQTSGASGYTQGPCKVVDAGGTPTFIFKERASVTAVPSNVFAYVVQWNGTAFTTLGTKLNRTGNTTGSSNISMVDTVAATYSGTQVCAAWTEYLSTVNSNSMSDSAPQVFAACWNGSSWVAQGGAANVNTSNRAYDVTAAWFNGQLYLAWTERTATGPAQLYVRTWNGSSWVTAGTRTRDTTNGWAFRPQLAVDGTKLYLAWEEQGNLTTWAYSQPSYAHPSQIYTDQYDGTTWTRLGGSLNMDTAQGSAVHPAIASTGNQPMALFAEVKYGSFRSVYGKQWNGIDWAPATCNITPVALGPYTAGQVVVSQTMAGNSCGGGTLTWTSSGLPAGLSGCNSVTGTTCIISGTVTTATTYTATISLTDGGSNSASINPVVIVSAAPSVTTNSLPTGTQGSAYSVQTISTSGGTIPVTCVANSGVPTGMTVHSGCTIDGTSSVSGSFTVNVTATDANSISSTPHNVFFTINPNGAPSGGSSVSGNVKVSGNAIVK